MGLYLRKTDENDMVILFNWANDEVCRKNSFSSRKITIEEHKEWFNKRLHNDLCDMFILMDDDIHIGTIRIDYEASDGYISYSIANEYRGKSMGKKIIGLAESDRRIVEKACRLIGRVKKDNVPSIKTFEGMNYSREEYDDYFEYSKKIGG